MKDKRIQILRDLGTGKRRPKCSAEGLCVEMCAFRMVSDLAPKWSEYSGNNEYPVPHPTLDPYDAFWSRKQLWRNDAYGDARRRLCLFLADELERLEGES